MLETSIDTINSELAPTIGKLTDPGLLVRTGILGASRKLSREIVVGIDDGLIALSDGVDSGARRRSMLSHVEEVAEKIPTFIWLIAAGFGLAIVGLVIWITILMRRLSRIARPTFSKPRIAS